MPFLKSLLKSLKKILFPKGLSYSRRKTRPSKSAVKAQARRKTSSQSKAITAVKKSPKKLEKGANKASGTTAPIQQSNRTKSAKSAKTKSEIKASSPVKKSAAVIPDEKQLVGDVTHYFPRIHVVVIKITATPVRVGDNILIEGVSKPFRQKVVSLQIESVNVNQGKKGQLVGLKVAKEAAVGDKVYKVDK